ncbi:MAG: GFA family protein [Magnetospirillum sp.]|nr:GFA family protein [Magnetospirillum sp.]
MIYEGGCRCGAVRYRITGEPLSAGYCHCGMCQQAAGAPVVAWVAFRRSDFRIVKGEPESAQANARAVRRLCGECGTALTFEYSAHTETVDVTIASLDDPNATEPVYRIWSSPRLPWLHSEGEDRASRPH